MNLKEIREIIDLISRTDVAEIEIEKSGVRIRIRRGAGGLTVSAPSLASPGATAATPLLSAPGPSSAAGPEPALSANEMQICAPIVGTFYRAPAPDAKPYVEVGDTVRKGQVLGLIEAMKLMNEIESEADGRIKAILVDNTRSVEYGTPLFLIEISGSPARV